ncbi:MAG: GH92 family glycosyl hydrolase [Dysgonamonadaceae bacterium]|jgi:predicted alpha-1,2-mannosidase|nr:GH92 family glycosyl hydrolase [Dysgonamonadaceae bacterium]
MNSKTWVAAAVLLFSVACTTQPEKEPVDYVNPYIGNISHLLVPTYATSHLPNSMLRVHPLRDDFAGNKLKGLPLLLSGHRGHNGLTIHPARSNDSGINAMDDYEYDNEVVKPYFYSVYLDGITTGIRFAPSHQSAVYEVEYTGEDAPCLIFKAKNGKLLIEGNTVSGYQNIDNTATKAYVYLETEQVPVSKGVFANQTIDTSRTEISGEKAGMVFRYAPHTKKIRIRYGVSFISEAQARKNLYREISGFDLDAVARKGRDIWNETLSKIKVKGNSEDDKTVFYTSLYRTYERMICLSEDGKYYSGFDEKVHDDEGIPFYNDDWLWDTYRATHPLRVIIEPEMQTHMLRSFIRMAEQTENFWMPTFPEIWGDSHRMNANHGVATVLDCYEKGLTDFDLEKAYLACKNAITEKTLAPWSNKKAGVLDRFYKENGYFPALPPGEQETAPEVDSWEKRQPVAVTLGTVYDEWCLANIAKRLGKTDDYNYFIDRSLNYRKLFNPETGFFHPKDKEGRFIENVDYRYYGGLGARNAYDENNGWIFRWDIQHNIADLIALLGGNRTFVAELERMYDAPLGKPKYEFYALLPDHTGNVGQFSMGNETALHIPYLYNYAGEPWRTQKRVRSLLTQWFRNDLMGVPGDEDGGGMTAFVVFSQLGFYPVTPGLPVYVIGSPTFEETEIRLADGKTFRVVCRNYAPENKYIQSARLNGNEWNQSWFTHDDLIKGGTLELMMGKYPNKAWASTPDAVPPSFEMPDKKTFSK